MHKYIRLRARAQRTSQVASICQRMNLYLYMYACVTQTLEEEKSSVHSGQLLSAESDQKKRKKLLFVRSVGKRRELWKQLNVSISLYITSRIASFLSFFLWYELSLHKQITSSKRMNDRREVRGLSICEASSPIQTRRLEQYLTNKGDRKISTTRVHDYHLNCVGDEWTSKTFFFSLSIIIITARRITCNRAEHKQTIHFFHGPR